MKILSGKQRKARRAMLYGDNGIGKSTLAAKFPRPLVLNMEEGCADIDVDKTEKLNTEQDVIGAISWLVQNEHPYRTLIVDTADWLERKIFHSVAEGAGKKTIEEIGYGKGYEAAAKRWEFLIGGFETLWNRGMNIVLTAHLKIEKFSNPEGASYNYYSPALHDKGSWLVVDWCDEVLFLHRKVDVTTEDQGFNKTRSIAIGGTDRIMYTSEAASHVAKNRLGMQPILPLAWEPLAYYMGLDKPGNVDGIVVDGSSNGAAERTGFGN